ncbi:ectonucleotide pyrophosphatase/phosphodiesterase family member 5-like [Amphiura filiformis]|uniref:ectonucleotide pyrophosphatase/phosphodiesterase family member 5-like n=1 Tax=Amphiura filiformis TaxID=82378 RepID=UPI003B222C9D
MATTTLSAKVLFAIVSAAVVATSVATGNTKASYGKVLFMTFDGLRWDYVDRTSTPNFHRLIKNGVTANYVSSSFITKTFPTHYTLATGLHQESHGFVGNQMYDPVLDAHWTIRNQSKDPIWWDDGEPIWVTNQKQGYQSGVFQYPASDVRIRGHYPTYKLPKYDGRLPNNDVIDLVIPLFANDSINLGVLYFGTMDSAGHTYGPDSAEVDQAMQECDNNIGYLLDRLEAVDKLDEVNIIITADHGMTSVSSENNIRLDDYLDRSLYQYDENNPIYGIWPKNEDDTDAIYDALSNAHPNLTVYKKADIPERYHYKSHRRIAPILAVADDHWHIMLGNETSPYKGAHGYDNALQSMRTFFVAHGPAFKDGYKSQVFSAVDFYPMMCSVLGLTPSPNNGSLESIMPMFSGAAGTLSVSNLVIINVLCLWMTLYITF